MPLPSPAIHPFGEAAVLVELEGSIQAQALAASLREASPHGLLAVVPGLQSLLVEFDPLRTDAADVERHLRAHLRRPDQAPGVPGRLRTIPVAYGGPFGPDLEEVAQLTGRTPGRVIAVHSRTELHVLFDGFAPGFAYLGELPQCLRVPRLATPRTRTPRGSVAIAGAMSGIYPADLPGGWRVIGRTPVKLFDATREPPAYLVPGDRVRFAAMNPDDWDRHATAPVDW